MSKKHKLHSVDRMSPVEMDKMINQIHQNMLQKLMRSGGGML